MAERKFIGGNGYRYGFNGKENDNEVKGDGNNVNFGDRMFDARVGRWLSIDRLYKDYPFVSPYSFAFNTPLQAVDPDGQKVLWINGYYNTGALSGMAGSKGGQAYWTPEFIKRGNLYMNDHSNKFIDGRGKWNSTGTERYNEGYAYAKANYADLISGMKTDAKGKIIETFKVVSHSMGAAYSEGVIKYLEEKGLTVERVVHFSPADTDDFKASAKPRTTQLDYSPDIVLGYKNFDDVVGVIGGVDESGVAPTPAGRKGVYNHALTKSDPIAWDALADLDNIQFALSHSVDSPIPDKYDDECNCQMVATTNYYSASGNKNNTTFKKVIKNQTPYTNSGGGNTYTSGGGIREVKKETKTNAEF